MFQPSISWNRVLPRPPGFYHLDDHSGEQSHSLFPHHLVSIGEPTNPSSIRQDRRNTIHNATTRDRPPIAPFFRAYPINAYSDLLPGPLTRKRAASLMAEGSSPREASPASTSNSNPEITSQFCLCQPDPKIPRPRNAFILYRQHHQAAVVQQHPGLANPDISKIIGEQWRTLPAKNKNEWKALAEEEKARHQQQYPDYRYQPRRYGRNVTLGNSSSSAPPTVGPTGHCLRCGGKVMNPPTTPNGPSSPITPAAHMSAAIPTASIPTHTFSRNGMAPRRPLGYGQPSPPAPQTRQDPYVIPQSHSYASIQDRHRDYGPAPVSPAAKRRRFNGDNVYIPPRAEQGPHTPYPYSARRPSLPPPDTVRPRMSIPMGPPSTARPAPSSANRPLTGHDPSLTLPPLQTQGASGQSSRQEPAEAGDSSSSRIEKVVGQMHVLNKIKLLSRVAPPLPSPSLPSSGHDDVVRGAVVAVDGPNSDDVNHLSTYLADFLRKEGSFSVRSFTGPALLLQSPERESATLHDATVEYLKAISEWHSISHELVRFISPSFTPSSCSTADENSEPTNQNAEDEKEKEKDTGSVSPKTVPVQQQQQPHQSSPKPYERPVAIIPHYQLSTVESAARAIPIVDAYAPIEHWQWAAALWRGCVGPDVTVVLRDCDEAEVVQRGGGMPVEVRLGVGAGGAGPNTSRQSGGGSGHRNGTGPTATGGGGSGASSSEARAVVVRKLKDDRLDGGGTPGEKALRRVAFEIVEFLRR